MNKKSCLKLIYKIHSTQLKKSKWNLTLPLQSAMDEHPDIIVSLSDSQALRFIDEINGVLDINAKVKSIQRKIKNVKKRPKSRETKMFIKNLYESLYNIQFQKDYICVIMDSNKDYDRANQGFIVNGIKYRRLLGTNGGIKCSTIVYVNEEIYEELKKRIDNGRNKNVPLVPAKLEAYQALVCSGSEPIPEPKGVIVVKDCFTHFKDNVIMINDEKDGEPILTEIDGFDVEHDDSDGFGLMLPSYSRRVNEYLNGDSENVISGMNTRWAWNKGMVYTFDYIEFGKKIAGTYEITDVWGHKRDIRDSEVILTESMLKLWDSYDSWKDYYKNCQDNHYQFSVPKTTPDKLENVRNTNYQFLQSYEFTDNEIQELCQPTIDEINDVLSMDYRKSLVFLSGFGLNDKNVFNNNTENYIRALMIDEKLINDSFMRKKIWNMISKRIEMAKRGAVKINANFAMISGDPYALCQSMFGLEITGLLKAGEVYHKYWIDKNAHEIACFRAPMTCANNIRKLKLNHENNCKYWYQYITTAIILNAWDTTCDAMNGADKDGDTFMTTDNSIILKNSLNPRTIVCVQRKAEKKIVTEDDIISANKLAFNDDIGVITNHVTSMFEVQAAFDKNSPEYKTLEYRIMCGQNYQQNSIDRAKGIIAKPMPEYWYNVRDNVVKDNDDEKTIENKNFNRKIAASNKPYFMTYVYPTLRNQNNTYNSNSDNGACRRFGSYGIHNMKDLYNYEPKTPEMIECLKYHPEKVGINPCTVNKICWLFEKEFNKYSSFSNEKMKFDYSILKSDVSYSKKSYNEILEVYKNYRLKLNAFQKKSRTERIDSFEIIQQRKNFIDKFKIDCEAICTNESELCDIVVDICYKSENTKQFAWDICGETIIENLLKRNNYIINYPELVDNDGEFEYCGENFVMKEKIVRNENDDNIE